MSEDIVVYYITGRQLGPLSVPDSWCEECDLTIRAIRSELAAADPGGSLSFTAKPWMRHAMSALCRGGWHPPVVVIDGKVFSQGVVPDRERLRTKIAELVAVRLSRSAGRNP